jgi:hypothetical protein
MASVEVNKLLMRAVSDQSFREKFLEDPAAAAKEAGAPASAIKELGTLDTGRLQSQFGHLTRVSGDLLDGSLLQAGHSRDWSDRANIHDNDGHIHDKAGSSFRGDEFVVLPAEANISAVRDALKDPAVLKEIQSNPAIQQALRKAGGKG